LHYLIAVLPADNEKSVTSGQLPLGYCSESRRLANYLGWNCVLSTDYIKNRKTAFDG